MIRIGESGNTTPLKRLRGTGGYSYTKDLLLHVLICTVLWIFVSYFSILFSVFEKESIIMLVLLIATLICSSAAAQPRCGELYVSYDLSRNFNETIAHTIHSMTVQGLRLFNPRATVDNRVPTVNHNIKDEVSSASAEPQKSRRRSR